MSPRWGSVLADVLSGKSNALWICYISTETLTWFWGSWLFPCNKLSQVLKLFLRHQTERLLFCRDLWIHIYREQTLDNDKLALVSASLIREKWMNATHWSPHAERNHWFWKASIKNTSLDNNLQSCFYQHSEICHFVSRTVRETCCYNNYCLYWSWEIE